MTAHGAPGGTCQPRRIRADDAPAHGASRDSTLAPFLTNSNYRVILPAPESGSGAGASAAFADRSSRSPGPMPVSRPPWVSPSSRSKTYFPASSPIVGGAVMDSSAFGDGAPSARSAAGDTANDDDGDTDMETDDLQELRTEHDSLPYEIHAWSNHSANFLPHNILVDRPHDQASRWSTNTSNHRQFITLRLERPALVRSIKFGKYYKNHVCNLKEFKVFGGMTEDSMVELLYSGLRNDSEAEIITLQQKLHGYYIPSQFIKIQPLLAYDQKFNFSIWHVELCGTMDPHIVGRLADDFSRFKERQATRLCLKFLRDRDYTCPLESLAQQTGLRLEAPILASIREALIVDGDYDRTEQLLYQAERSGMLAESAAKIPYAAAWSKVESPAYATPPARGGHPMCVDEQGRTAYLYGGWDGANNLDDLWALDLDTGKWKCISMCTRNQGGPGPRSCHAMCFDSVHKCVYVMGTYIDHDYRGNTGLDNDLYCYDTLRDEWLVLSENTEVMNGPKLVFNTQMVFDPVRCRIYVYGGKVVLPNASDSTIVYCGLYCFDLRRHRWTRLKPDLHILEQEQHVRGRYYHSLLINPEQQQLYIISSRRDITAPSDIVIYDIATDTFYEKLPDLNTTTASRQLMTQERYLAEQQQLLPQPQRSAGSQCPCLQLDPRSHHPPHTHLLQDGRTVRATLNAERQEIYVLASVQADAHSMPLGSPRAPVLAARSSCSSRAGRHEHDGGGLPFVCSLYTQSSGASFHACSSLMDSGLRYEPDRAAASGSGQAPGNCRQHPDSSQHRDRPAQPEHTLMVVLCYHIPTETWSEVYNSTQAPRRPSALAARNGHSRQSPGAEGGGERSARPAVPPPRFAQDWVFDRATNRHIMFGGNPNQPSDKSARYSDTWKMALVRPGPPDMLRRALYLVRRRRFLDMCMGAAPPVACPQKPTCDTALAAGRAADEYGASAIPSPNSTIIAGGAPSGPPSPAAESRPSRHAAQRRQAAAAAAPEPAPTRASTPKPSPAAVVPTAAASPAAAPRSNTAQALAYLQRFVAPLVDSAELSEYQSFHALSTALFQIPTSQTAATSPDELRKARAAVFESLLVYFAEGQQQPQLHLDNLPAMLFQ
ncbi:hypothetical protein H4R19_000096 [Coemansia spiralis]|nr:hypothetical protein H4R19_000096 [Coemansia spiralis]